MFTNTLASIAGAAYFVDRLNSGSEAARETYIKFTPGAGGSDDPLRDSPCCRVDAHCAPYDRMDAVDQIEAILEDREG